MKSLETTSFQNDLKELEDKVSEKYFQKQNGDPLTGHKLCAKLRALFEDFAVLKAKIQMDRKSKTARAVSLNAGSHGPSQLSTDISGTCNKNQALSIISFSATIEQPEG